MSQTNVPSVYETQKNHIRPNLQQTSPGIRIGFGFEIVTSGAGISMVSVDPGLTKTSETASLENSVSSSLLNPPC